MKFTTGDVLRAKLPPGAYALWHDRAVFHFLTDAGDRASYKRSLNEALRDKGYLLIATFAEEGPDKCSGLPVRRYSVDALQREFGDGFRLLDTAKESHRTPAGAVQKFNYCLFRRR